MSQGGPKKGRKKREQGIVGGNLWRLFLPKISTTPVQQQTPLSHFLQNLCPVKSESAYWANGGQRGEGLGSRNLCCLSIQSRPKVCCHPTIRQRQRLPPYNLTKVLPSHNVRKAKVATPQYDKGKGDDNEQQSHEVIWDKGRSHKVENFLTNKN